MTVLILEWINVSANIIMLIGLTALIIRLESFRGVFMKASLYVQRQEEAQAEFKELAKQLEATRGKKDDNDL